MSSTNKTPNYGLSQFLGTDHPSFLHDVNADNLKIDTILKQTDDKIVSSAGISQSTADGRYVPKSVTAPTQTGLTAEQMDRMYVDSDNIVRVKPVEE